MFTGIVQHLGRVREARMTSERLRLTVVSGPLATGAAFGDSVCVNGVCLTVTDAAAQDLTFDVIGETLSRSTLGELSRDAPVNLEPSLRPTDRLGGHFVTGHIDGVGTVAEVLQSPSEVRMRFWADVSLTGMMIPRGSITVDGVSLTLTDAADGSFGVALIPHTLQETTLGMRRAGDHVNIETDLIGKWVVKLLAKGDRSGGVTEEFLREHGFA